MNLDRLRHHADAYVAKLKQQKQKMVEDLSEREERKAFFASYTSERLVSLSEDEFTAYMSRLWAMLVWGNKQYYVDKVIDANGFDNIKAELAELVWGQEPVPARWEGFRARTKQIGPAMMSEILGHVHADGCMVWNRRAYVGLDYIGVPDLPRYNYQVTGERYEQLCATALEIEDVLRDAGASEPDLLAVDYFIWDELQVVDRLAELHQTPPPAELAAAADEADTIPDFVHHEIRDKLSEIGTWLGFATSVETKVAEGAQVDAIWESSIGNMGRVIYVFEVQTKGSIDSLLLNLLKARNNPAVQGVVAVSDAEQLEKIQRQAHQVADLAKGLRCWDYQEVLKVHASLEMVNESINKLQLVPESF